MLRRLFDFLLGPSTPRTVPAAAKHRAAAPAPVAIPVSAAPSGATGGPRRMLAAQSPPEATPAIEPGFVARRPLIGRRGEIAGFEFRLDDAATWNILNSGSDFTEATFATALFGSMRAAATTGRLAFASVPATMLMRPGVVGECVPGMLVCVLPGDAASDGPLQRQAMTERVKELRARGVKVGWLANWLASTSERPPADFVLLQYVSGAIEGLVESGRQWRRAMPDAMLIATDIASIGDLETAVRGGIALSSGTLSRSISEREQTKGRKLEPQQMRLFKLLNDLVIDVDASRLSEQLKGDVVLSYRLIRYANSAALGLSRSIDSIPQALMLIGRNELYRWVSVMLIHSASDRTLSGALQEISLVRARLLELLARARAIDPPDGLFTVGMFSMLDAMLQMPIAQALEPLNLPPQAKRALVDGDGPWRPYLDLVKALEWADATSIARHAGVLQIPLPVVWKLNDDAQRWAQAALTLPDSDNPPGLATRPAG